MKRTNTLLAVTATIAMSGCVKPQTHRPATRRGDDATVWLLKDEFAKFGPSASLDHRVAWWEDALSGQVPTSFPASDQIEESGEKMHRLWYGAKDPVQQ